MYTLKDPELVNCIGLDREALEQTLRSCHEELLKTGNWRPLTNHVVALVELALSNDRKLTKSQRALSFLKYHEDEIETEYQRLHAKANLDRSAKAKARPRKNGRFVGGTNVAGNP